ncbi:hypothetical protein QUF70_06760 [Desulfobacterales bacterium HSG17]|nr:hypothetical protein [Desulfobacterales bacterium HSG17]
MTQKDRYVLLPIETKIRELHAKFLLGLFTAEAGIKVILAQKSEMVDFLSTLPNGIFIDKGIAHLNRKSYNKNQKRGNMTVAWCEEGLAFRDDEAYLHTRISNEVYGMLHRFFAWGRYQADLISTKASDKGGKIVSVGNPRFDLLRDPFRTIFDPGVEKIRAQHGKFILINTSFSRYNHYYGPDHFLKNMRAQGRIQNQEQENFFVEWRDYLGQIFNHFSEMVKYLSTAFPELTIVVRPHPSENMDEWKKRTKELDNVKIIREGNAIYWILASEIAIHNSCTTGIESYVLDHPVIAYCPVTHDVYDSYLPNAVSHRAANIEELETRIKKLLSSIEDGDSSTLKTEEQEKAMDRYVSGLRDRTACETIIQELLPLFAKSMFTSVFSVDDPIKRLQRAFIRFSIWFKHSIRKILKGEKAGYTYLAEKFPGLEREELVDLQRSFSDVTHRFQDINIEKISGMHTGFLLHK